MKTRLLLLLSLFAAAACAPKKQAPEKPKQYTMAQFMDVVQITGGAFSPDESKVLFSSKATGIFNAYEVDLKSGETKQLTRSTDNAIFAEDYFPEGGSILYSADSGGNEITHLYELGNEKSHDLVLDKKAKASFFGWSFDKKYMFYVSNARDKKYFDVMQRQVNGKQEKVLVTTLYTNNDGFDVSAISDDNRFLALTENKRQQPLFARQGYE